MGQTESKTEFSCNNQFLLDVKYLTNVSYLSGKRNWDIQTNSIELTFFSTRPVKCVKGSLHAFQKVKNYTLFHACRIPKQNYIRLFNDEKTKELVKAFRFNSKKVIKQLVYNLASILFSTENKIKSHGNLSNALFLGENGLLYTNVYDGNSESFITDIQTTASLVRLLGGLKLAKKLETLSADSNRQELENDFSLILDTL